MNKYYLVFPVPASELQGPARSTDGAHGLWVAAAVTARDVTPKTPRFCSSRPPSGAAVAAHMPAGDFPSPSECITVNHQRGFAFHFPSASGCVTKPPDSPLLSELFYTTKSKPQTCRAAKKTNRAGGPLSQLRPGALKSKAFFPLSK